MLDLNKSILYYNRIKKDLGVKFMIIHSENMNNDDKTNVYSKISLSCIPAINPDRTYDFASICLNTLDILTGDLSEYPRIVILYDNSPQDHVYNIELEDLPEYVGDVFDMQYGVLKHYSDSNNHVVIDEANNIDTNESEYSCYIDNSSKEFIPSIFTETNCQSKHLAYAKKFVETTIRKVDTSKKLNAIKKLRRIKK